MSTLSEFEKEVNRQEVVRRNIEALCTAARCADVVGGDGGKTVKVDVGKKLEEHIKALSPIK